MSDLQDSFRDLKKNIQALKQANLTVSQMPNVMKGFGLWWKITRNLRILEGSWTGTLKTFIRLFKGVPRRHIPQPFDMKGGAAEIRQTISLNRLILAWGQ